MRTLYFPQSGLDAFGRWICRVNWFADLPPLVGDLTNSLTSTLTSAIDLFVLCSIILTNHGSLSQSSHSYRSLIPSICSFLSGRKQFVKVGLSTSSWASISAGIPQGTKLRPIFFLIMVSDLASHSPLKSSNWMYVDDLTISEATQLSISYFTSL